MFKKICLSALCVFSLSSCQAVTDAVVTASNVLLRGPAAVYHPTRPKSPAPKPAPQAVADREACKVVGIADGDTFKCLDDYQNQLTVRMAQIDAPERGQPFGQKAKEALSHYIFGQTVYLETSGQDQYGRLLAVVFNERGENINLLMVEEGLAWAYKEYMTDHIYAAAEAQATENNRGLWSENGYVYPSEWRRGVRPQRVTTAPTESPASRQRNNRQSGRLANNGGTSFTCGTKRFCTQMRSCAEARFYLNQCGVRRLDRDRDGVPCESLC